MKKKQTSIQDFFCSTSATAGSQTIDTDDILNTSSDLHSAELTDSRMNEFDSKTMLAIEKTSLDAISFLKNHGFDDIIEDILNFASMADSIPTQLRLISNTTSSIELSRLHIASLISNVFLCRFLNPHWNATKLFNHVGNGLSHLQRQKIKFFRQYFESLKKENCIPDWSSLKDTEIGLLTLCLDETIEDQNAAQVDFCNRRIGGGVLTHGSVQEEIMFLCRPECIAALLFTDPLDDHEAIIIEGANIFSGYRGYSSSLEWQPLSTGKEKSPIIIAIDAIKFKKRDRLHEFRKFSIERELNKAYCGFSMASRCDGYDTRIATGHWGCGAFNGNKQLKGIIQLLAASVSDSSLIYCCFGDREFYEEFGALHQKLVLKRVSVAELFHWITQYRYRNFDTQTGLLLERSCTLFDYIDTQVRKLYR
ncbi:hypothetical protein HDV02_004711 [Globomyces sp. JEL0801]|nr:hypothetical protein HDV02_004711 [Globomyces sp. JEL0801]